MTATFTPVQVAGRDPEGVLAFVDGHLMAVLTRLVSDYGGDSGHWYLEAGFGPLDAHHHPTFADLEGAQTWIDARLIRK